MPFMPLKLKSCTTILLIDIFLSRAGTQRYFCTSQEALEIGLRGVLCKVSFLIKKQMNFVDEKENSLNPRVLIFFRPLRLALGTTLK